MRASCRRKADYYVIIMIDETIITGQYSGYFIP